MKNFLSSLLEAAGVLLVLVVSFGLSYIGVSAVAAGLVPAVWGWSCALLGFVTVVLVCGAVIDAHI